MKRNESQLLDEARLVGGACNVSGLVHSLSRAMSDLWAIAGERGLGTDWVNKHPVLLLYLEQINYLSGYGDKAVSDAYSYQPSTPATELAEATK